ncbi:MAG: CBS domain-containing protein [Bdellovibrionales bacterium]|nr:CBS domain-containing protein [Bdellovibrionales bacterium]NQZ20322.1 CBS domain-containing protein [Bdellovibrionales bacterium]
MDTLKNIYIKDVLKIPSTATITQGVEMMAAKNVGAALITEGRKIVGIFSERDLMMRVVSKKKDPNSTNISQVMTAKVLTISVDARPTVAMEAMFKKRIRHLPVVDANQKIIGMVSLRIVLAFIVKNLAELNRNMQEELDQLRFLNL